MKRIDAYSSAIAKNVKCLFMIATLCGQMFCMQARAGEVFGVDTSSGGDRRLIYSSIEEVKEAFKTIKKALLENGGFREYMQDLESISDVETVLAIKKMQSRVTENGETNTSLVWDVKKSPIVFNDQGPCIAEDGREADASTQHYIGAPICFSTYRLQAVPRDSLDQQIYALFVHELVHHHGYGKVTAERLQFYLLKESMLRILHRIAILKFSGDAKRLADEFSSGQFSNSFCIQKSPEAQDPNSAMSELRYRLTADNVQSYFFELKPQIKNFVELKLKPIRLRFQRLKTSFCGGQISRDGLEKAFRPLAQKYKAVDKELRDLFMVPLNYSSIR